MIAGRGGTEEETRSTGDTVAELKVLMPSIPNVTLIDCRENNGRGEYGVKHGRFGTDIANGQTKADGEGTVN
jgi:hypothetical protein